MLHSVLKCLKSHEIKKINIITRISWNNNQNNDNHKNSDKQNSTYDAICISISI